MRPFGSTSLFPPISDNVKNYQMAAGVARTVTWPPTADRCSISASSPFYVSTGTATVPVADALDGSGSALNVSQRTKNSGETSFSMISNTDQNISVEFWGTS